MTDQELKELVASLAINTAENSKLIKEVGQEIRELRASQAEISTQIRAEIKEADKKRIASQEKTDEQITRVTQRVKELSEMYGGVSDHLGIEAELNFTQALKESPILNQVEFDKIKSNVSQEVDNKKVEIDILMLNGDSVAVVEVKRHLNSKHIEHLHDKTIPNFLSLFPQYKDKKLYVALATYNIPRKAKPYVNKLIQQYGYALITPDRTGYDIEIDTTYMRYMRATETAV